MQKPYSSLTQQSLFLFFIFVCTIIYQLYTHPFDCIHPQGRVVVSRRQLEQEEHMQERKLELSLDRLSFSFISFFVNYCVSTIHLPPLYCISLQGRGPVSRRQREQEEHMQERKLELSLDRLDAKLAVYRNRRSTQPSNLNGQGNDEEDLHPSGPQHAQPAQRPHRTNAQRVGGNTAGGRNVGRYVDDDCDAESR